MATNMKMWSCHKCNRQFQNRSSFSRHMSTCSMFGENRPHRCTNCTKSFTRKDVRDAHFKRCVAVAVTAVSEGSRYSPQLLTTQHSNQNSTVTYHPTPIQQTQAPTQANSGWGINVSTTAAIPGPRCSSTASASSSVAIPHPVVEPITPPRPRVLHVQQRPDTPVVDEHQRAQEVPRRQPHTHKRTTTIHLDGRREIIDVVEVQNAGQCPFCTHPPM